MVLDKNNREVKTGSLVKVLFIDPGFISTFPYKEAKIMKTMINKTFEVVGIKYGKALVHQPFDALHSFTLALASEEMELVDNIWPDTFTNRHWLYDDMESDFNGEIH